MTNKISVLRPEPGIARDGTDFAKRSWIDGKWVRFQRGLPRKMGGYQQLITDLDNIPRDIFIYPNSPNFNVYVADYESLKYFTMDQYKNLIGNFVDRTPDLFHVNQNNIWQFDTLFSTVSNSNTIVAHAAQSLSSIDNTIETPVYYGDASLTTPLVATGTSVSGGIVSLHPFLFMYGNSGDVKWSNANDPTTIMDDARVTGSKVVAGFATRGGNSSPAGILWSLDSVIRVTQVGTTSIEFNFDTVSNESSIISSSCVIEYDYRYFWIGIDKFLFYDGTVQELQNSFSTNYFFDNLNYAQKQKIWATKITRYGEIWWFFPFGDSIECNHAIIYNVREKTWYDTPVDRGAGYFTQVLQYPIWSDNVGDGNNSIWVQETGVDNVDTDGDPTPIQSNITSSIFSFPAYGIDEQFNGIDKNSYLYRIEPDFNQSGDMSLTVTTRKYANSEPVVSDPVVFSENTEKIDLRVQGREMSLTFESNDVGGFYEMGQVLTVVNPGDDRP